MGNTVQLKKNGQPVFPVTDVSLVMGLQDAIKLPPVKVTTLPTASAETAGKMYYVGPDANDEYERYITSATGGSYEWIDLGDTSIPLPSIADNLVTDDANTALSARQGKVLNEEISELDLKVGKFALTPNSDANEFIDLSGGIGSTVSLTPTSSGNPWRYYIVDVVPGDTLIINGTGGSSPRIWGVLNSSNVLLSVAPTSISLVNYELVAPEAASKIIINDNSGSTSYQIKKASAEGQINKVAESLTDELVSVKNEINGSEENFLLGFVLNEMGALKDDNISGITPFVPVVRGDNVVFHNGYTAVGGGAFAIVYDGSKNMLSGQYYSMDQLDTQFPERVVTLGQQDAAFVKMTFKVGSGAFVSINGKKVWAEENNEIGIKDYHLDSLGVDKQIYGKGGYGAWQTGFVRDSDGSINPSSTANSRTGYIDIEGYDTIRTVMSITSAVSNASLSFYDSSHTFISSVVGKIGTERGFEERILKVPSNAKYIRTSIYNEYTGEWYLYGVKMQQLRLSPIAKRQKVTMEFGNLDADGQMKPYATDFFDNARTPLYYKLQSVNLPYSYKIYVYGSDYALIDTISASANTDYELNINNWHKFVINYTANLLPVKEIVIDLDVIDKSYNIITAKTVKTFQYLVKYKKGRGLYVDGDSDYSEAYNMADDLISNTLRFYLPTNYSPTGEPVKLIYKAHGSNGYSWIDLDTWGGDSSIDYLADEGFALYDMFAGTSYYSAIINPSLTHDSATRIANYNVPIQLAAQVAAYEWIVSHFNVDKRVYVFGKSHGGMAGIYATNKIVPTRAVALFAPLITPIGDLYQPWGNHSNECSMCLDDMCFIPPVGMTFDQMVTAVNTKASGWKDILLANIRQQSGLNAYINGVTNIKQAALLSSLMDDDYKVVGGMDDVIRHSETPVKIWCAPDDAEVVFANGWNFIKSLQNGGSNAQFREFPTGTGGHYFDSFTDASSIKDTVTTALGVQYTAPRAYIELVNYFNQF